VVISHTTTDLHGDEGYIQRANVSVKLAIQHNQQLYISIWAVNQVCLFGECGPTHYCLLELILFVAFVILFSIMSLKYSSRQS